MVGGVSMITTSSSTVVPTVREACRKRTALDGVDAQALEHALTITERERDDAYAGIREVRKICTELLAEETDRLRGAVAKLIAAGQQLAGELEERVGEPAQDAIFAWAKAVVGARKAGVVL